MDRELFFEKLFINSETADQICKDLKMGRPEYTALSIELDNERKEQILGIKRIRSLYHNKKDSNFNFL